MSEQKKGARSARSRYRQLFLSGYEHLAQPRNQKRDSEAHTSKTNEPAKIRKGERSYKLSIEIVVEQIGNDRNEFDYRILLNDDPNISVAPYSIRSKKETGQAIDLPQTGNKGGTSFSMVYGIYKNGERALSHTPQHPIQKVAPQLYGFILGAIDRAIECTILLPKDAPRDDDTRKRTEGTPTPKSLGTDKEKGRRKKVRPEILPETLPKEAPVMVEVDGQVLGRRPANTEVRPLHLGSGTDNGSQLAAAIGDGETPDIGF